MSCSSATRKPCSRNGVERQSRSSAATYIPTRTCPTGISTLLRRVCMRLGHTVRNERRVCERAPASIARRGGRPFAEKTWNPAPEVTRATPQRCRRPTAKLDVRAAPRLRRRDARGWPTRGRPGSACRSAGPARRRRAAGSQRSVTTSRPNARIDAASSPNAASFWRIQRGISAPHASEKRASCVKLVIGMMPGTIGAVTPCFAASSTSRKYASAL